MWVFVPAQVFVRQWLESFKEFPPVRRGNNHYTGGSWNDRRSGCLLKEVGCQS